MNTQQIFIFDRKHFTEFEAMNMTRKEAEKMASVGNDERIVWQYNGISSSFIGDFNSGCLTPADYILTVK